MVARLPRVGAEVMIEKSQFNKDAKPTAHDFALICQEARLAMGPALGLLDAALKLAKKAGKTEVVTARLNRRPASEATRRSRPSVSTAMAPSSSVRRTCAPAAASRSSTARAG